MINLISESMTNVNNHQSSPKIENNNSLKEKKLQNT